MKTLMSLLIATSFCIIGPSGFAKTDQVSSSDKVVATKMALRDLWVDHIFWVRNVVVAKAFNNKKAQAAANDEVVANAKNIAEVIEPFYGKAASDQLFKLLAGHYGAIVDYMNATLPKPNKKAQTAATEKLNANAVEISDFLSGANPYLPKGTLVALLSAHGGHHVTQINQFQKKDYAGEAKTWTAMKKHMYVIADAMVDAIAKQFPEKF